MRSRPGPSSRPGDACTSNTPSWGRASTGSAPSQVRSSADNRDRVQSSNDAASPGRGFGERRSGRCCRGPRPSPGSARTRRRHSPASARGQRGPRGTIESTPLACASTASRATTLPWTSEMTAITPVYGQHVRCDAGGMPTPPITVVLIGATGDLSKRKLLPGLLHLFQTGLLRDLQVVGTSLDQHDRDSFVEFARSAIDEFAGVRRQAGGLDGVREAALVVVLGDRSRRAQGRRRGGRRGGRRRRSATGCTTSACRRRRRSTSCRSSRTPTWWRAAGSSWRSRSAPTWRRQ